MKRRTARILRHFANKLDPQVKFTEVVQPGAFRETQESLKLDLSDVKPVHFGGKSKVFGDPPKGFLTYDGDLPADLEKVIVTTLRKHYRRNGERLA